MTRVACGFHLSAAKATVVFTIIKPAMNNVWTIALRTPCTALRPQPSLPSWKTAVRLVAARGAHAARTVEHEAWISRSWTTVRQDTGTFVRFSGLQGPPKNFNLWRCISRQFSTTASLAKRNASPKKPQQEQRNHDSSDNSLTKLRRESLDWRRYDEDHGVPLPGGPLPTYGITNIFGPGIDASLGNHVLRVLQYRRLSGTLAERGISFPESSGFSQEVSHRALEYLRANYPVDEEAAAAAWAEEEARKIEDEIIKDAERLGLYKPIAQETQQEQGTEFGRQKYGQSGLDAIKQHYESQPVKQRKSQAEEVTQNTGTLVAARKTGELTTGESPKWWKKYEERALLSKDKTPPKMSAFQRLFPSLLVATAVVGLCIAFAQSYTPPPRSARLWPDMPVSVATCVAILLANTGVLVAWRVPQAWRFLNRYFYQAPGYPVALSVIGNVFSHQTLRHFAANMLVLMIVGPALHEQIGRGNFLAIYLASGVAGSFASLCWYVLRRNFVTASLGASGAVAGITAAICLVNPREHVRIPFTDYRVPISSYVLLAVLILMEFGGLYSGRTRADHMAHLGGYAMGIVGAETLRRQARQRRKMALEQREGMGALRRTWEGGGR